MTSALPALMSLCLAARSSREAITEKVALHWSVQTMRVFEAFEPSLRPMLEHLRALGVDASLDVYCREASRSLAGDEHEKDGSECTSSKPSSSTIRVHSERANVPNVVARTRP